MSDSEVPLKNVWITAPVDELFLMDCGDYEHWCQLHEYLQEQGELKMAMPVWTRASEDEFVLGFTLKSIDQITRDCIMFTADLNGTTLYGMYHSGNDFPHGGLFKSTPWKHILL